MQMNSVWIVHKTLHMLMLLRNAILRDGFPDVRCFTDSNEVLALVRHGMSPDVVIAEEGLTGMSGNDLLTLVDGMGGTRCGILLVPSGSNPTVYGRQTVVEGTAGFHESLLQTLHDSMKEELCLCHGSTKVQGAARFPMESWAGA